MTKIVSLIITFTCIYSQAYAQCESSLIFNNDSTNAVCIDSANYVINIVTNNYPDHSWGNWPSNSPVLAQEFNYSVCEHPVKGDTPISMYDNPSGVNMCSPYMLFGVGLNGIFYAGWGAMWFTDPNTMEENTDWNVEPTAMFNMDFNNAHSNNPGEYHYHGTPIVYYQDSLGIDGTAHSPLIGYAADGFPVYYKFVYSDPMDTQSSITGLASGYSLIDGNRPGDGITAPDGAYDGLYVEDYEFIESSTELDDCNGRFGITPDYPSGTYYYVITDNWPYFPRCFYGTVIDNSFRIGPNCPGSTAELDCSPPTTTSIEVLEGIALTIYPNPTGNHISIQSQNELPIDGISIYDQLGEVLIQSAEDLERIDLSSWPAGTYFIQITSNDQEVTKKFIKQ